MSGPITSAGPGYTLMQPAGSSMFGYFLLACDRCGALVADEGVHNAWHDEPGLARAIAEHDHLGDPKL